MKSSDFLLLFGNKDAIQIPRKIYHYVENGRPIFMLNEKKDDPYINVLTNLNNTKVIPNYKDDIYGSLCQLLTNRKEKLIKF
ncbi:MAG: hypothetical protein ACTSQP_24740 [Promethearchaeota archaeon]